MHHEPEGGDSVPVARDAVDSAKAKGDDIVIIDTAGRMQNKTNLMEELRKVHRVTNPHLVLFVADALAGNDAVEQAKGLPKYAQIRWGCPLQDGHRRQWGGGYVDSPCNWKANSFGWCGTGI